MKNKEILQRILQGERKALLEIRDKQEEEEYNKLLSSFTDSELDNHIEEMKEKLKEELRKEFPKLKEEELEEYIENLEKEQIR